MGFYKEDYYDECKGYCTYTLLLDVLDEIEDEQRYDDSLKDIQVRDIVTIDLFDLFNGDLYKMYFNGDSFEFNKRMNELLTKDKIKELSDAVNSSIYYNNETDFYKYESYMNEAKNNALSINQKATKSF